MRMLLQHKPTGAVVAMKIQAKQTLSRDPSGYERALTNLNREISIMRRLTHPNLLALAAPAGAPDLLLSETHLFLATEFCDGGDLEGLLQSRRQARKSQGTVTPWAGLDELEGVGLMRQIVAGLAHLKELNVVHRDLKVCKHSPHYCGLAKAMLICIESALTVPSSDRLLFSSEILTWLSCMGQTQPANILVKLTPSAVAARSTGPGSASSAFIPWAAHSDNTVAAVPSTDVTLKIGDFGLSRPLLPDQLAETHVGSPLYTAPEVLLNRSGVEYDGSVADLWSLGVVCFQMMTGQCPFGVVKPQRPGEPAFAGFCRNWRLSHNDRIVQTPESPGAFGREPFLSQVDINTDPIAQLLVGLIQVCTQRESSYSR
eukprot:SAG31_NODE_41_length_31342_cov_8.029286_16_plen_372_part_00